MVITATIRFPHFKQYVVRSIGSSRFYRKPENRNARSTGTLQQPGPQCLQATTYFAERGFVHFALARGIATTRAKEMNRLNPPLRLMSVAAVALLCSLTAAAAQSPLHRQPGQKEKQKLADQIASDGLNCPVVGVVDDAGKDDRGTMIRIHCSSLNGAASWDVRGIAARDAAGLRFESW